MKLTLWFEKNKPTGNTSNCRIAPAFIGVSAIDRQSKGT